MEVNLGVLGGRQRVSGTRLRAGPLEEKATLTQEFAKRCLPLFENETLVPVVDRVFPLEETGAAHAYMETNANFGKIVLRVEG